MCLSWLQDKQLQSSRGIIIANQTLVLQGISKATHGQYMCRATNPQGTVGSNEVYLDVKCKLFKWNIFCLTDCFAENFSFICVLHFCGKEKNLVMYIVWLLLRTHIYISASIYRSLANGVWFASNFPRELYDFIPQNRLYILSDGKHEVR